MKVELFPFQKKAVYELRTRTAAALGMYQNTHIPQVISLQAPTGAGKTIILGQKTMRISQRQYLFGCRILRL